MREITPRMKGTALIIISTMGFGLMQIFVALTSDAIGVMEQTFFRNLIGLIVVGIVATKEHISFFGERKYQPQLFGRSLSGFVGIILLFYAARNANQADVTILSRISMFTITLAAALFLHEKLTKMHIPAMALAFAGAFLAANPSFDSSFLPLTAALMSAICNTVAYTLLSYFAGRVNPLTVVMHFCVFSTVASIPLMAPDFQIPGGWDLFCLLMIGVFAAVGQITMTFAYRLAPASEISIYSQSAIIFNAIFGLIFLNEVPSWRTVIGGSMVIVASIFLFMYNQRHAAKNELTPTHMHAATSGGRIA